jgi:hypothetical protein
LTKKKVDERPALVLAAEVLCSELAHFADLGATLDHEAFGTQKSIDRGANALRQVGECETRIGRALTDLVQAINVVRDEQAKTAERIAARAKELEVRGATLRDLAARYEGLGGVAAQVSAAIRSLPTKPPSENGGSDSASDAAAALPELIQSVARAAEAAKVLSSDAESQGFPDVGRNAETLRQQILAAQNKMNLLLKKLRPGEQP